jgi:hypothetical protein
MAEPTPSGRRAGIETGPDGKSTGNIVCYPSDNANCIVVSTPQPGSAATGFLSPPEPTPFHDQLLVDATREINGVLTKLAQQVEQDPRRGSLHLILVPDGPMLAWVNSMATPVDDIRQPPSMPSM